SRQGGDAGDHGAYRRVVAARVQGLLWQCPLIRRRTAGAERGGRVNMQIIRASEMGFCFGVRRAVEMMEEAVRARGPMVSLGSVVHNPQVVDRLREEGLEVIKDVGEAAAKPVAITAHGVGPNVIDSLEDIGVEIIDTTCPIVTRS